MTDLSNSGTAGEVYPTSLSSTAVLCSLNNKQLLLTNLPSMNVRTTIVKPDTILSLVRSPKMYFWNITLYQITAMRSQTHYWPTQLVCHFRCGFHGFTLCVLAIVSKVSKTFGGQLSTQVSIVRFHLRKHLYYLLYITVYKQHRKHGGGVGGVKFTE